MFSTYRKMENWTYSNKFKDCPQKFIDNWHFSMIFSDFCHVSSNHWWKLPRISRNGIFGENREYVVLQNLILKCYSSKKFKKSILAKFQFCWQIKFQNLWKLSFFISPFQSYPFPRLNSHESVSSARSSHWRVVCSVPTRHFITTAVSSKRACDRT